jgi:predicted 3-demethylubiquinone-9 3-methyltransferase (glyoxalase superfamily)
MNPTTTHRIIPNLWFDGKALEAVHFYLSIFEGGSIINTSYYPKNEADGLAAFQKEFAGQILSVEFQILDMRLIAINAGPLFQFNEAISLMIPCRNQEEIDYYWHALTANGGQESMCGWLKDKYGLSWQVCPHNWAEIMSKPGAFQKMMGMKKFVLVEF